MPTRHWQKQSIVSRTTTTPSVAYEGTAQNYKTAKLHPINTKDIQTYPVSLMEQYTHIIHLYQDFMVFVFSVLLCMICHKCCSQVCILYTDMIYVLYHAHHSHITTIHDHVKHLFIYTLTTIEPQLKVSEYRPLAVGIGALRTQTLD